ncbi:Chemotaxis protein CheZ [Candidatus Defluviicoccus seviourii]|uniref:Chemotaxis protein CheZ n=1 Tax=Candidatus Defluviicoccus seviourii TaxID=2565273 RepID=A0A564WGD4_9PROT|nr:Chemotaxis protein CheZ [Candidatus Defluviicoccus seviourii]
MSDLSQPREFTAEIRRLQRGSSSHGADAGQEPCSCRGGGSGQILAAIADLKQMLSGVAIAPEAASGSSAPADGAESAAMRDEVAALRRTIQRTKDELAALRAKRALPVAVSVTTNELDAVVEATETATNCILASAEEIDGAVRTLRAFCARDEEVSVLEEIAERVVRIFEACNFQDITGQRITKVVNTVKSVEASIDRMIDYLGGPAAFAEFAAPAEDPEDDTHLLNGPPLDIDSKISQDDIDKLFS